ncbi:MAG: thiamine-phosphate kinase [Dehalococcoidia bacterium]|nr:MAG: thiamine-phosphate kinase [Dehalococcoidia bacterium]
MKVSEVGEFGLIEILAKMIETRLDVKRPSWKNIVAGIGDDAAAWKNTDEITLATTDCLVQNVHFKIGQAAWSELGWKALAINLSDIAAMGGTAECALVTLGLPADTDVEDVTELYRGLIQLGDQFGIAIAGGDITSSNTMFISLTVTGSAGKRLLRRSAAKPGDLIGVTGYLGAAAAGLRLISNGAAPTAEDAPLRQAFLSPCPRLAEGAMILAAGGRAAIDISDGLVADLGHICRASKVGARIDVEHIPVHPAARKAFLSHALDMALGGGEDYELLFTASAAVIDKVKAKTSLPVSVIGEITANSPGVVQTVDAKGRPYKFDKAGWDHFGKG